jgi:hypothetical protein
MEALKILHKRKQFLWNFSWENLGFGISVLNDQTFIRKQTSVGIDLSYLVQLSEATDLYFVLKLG